MVALIQHFEADFLWKVSLKILNSGIILKTFTHADTMFIATLFSYNTGISEKCIKINRPDTLKIGKGLKR